MKIKDKFIETIHKFKLIQRGDSIVVGVSGGPDSIALLHLLWSIRDEYNLKLHVVHLNHMLRGKEAEEDAKYVEEFCGNLGIKSFIFSRDVSKYSKEKGITFEEGGRELRYKLFYEIAKKTNSNKIAIAQNSNDQAETVLMRLMRGSGLEGLAAINYIRDDMIIRPLLDITRSEIEGYCEANNLNPRIDKTNLESIYTRNKIRLELIPYIQKNFNPNIIETLCRTSNILRDENDYLEEEAFEKYHKILERETEDLIEINLKAFNALHVSMKRRLIRIIIQELKGDLKNITLNHINQSIDIIREGKVNSKLNLPQDILIELGYNSIYIKIYKGDTKDIKDFQYFIPLNGSVFIKELGLWIHNIIINDKEISKGDKNTIYIDGNKVQGSLIVRNRRKGDKFTPLGMKGTKKIKDYFIDEKINRDIRDKIPLVCDNDNIIWIAGYRMSESYKIDNSTSKVVKLWIEEGCIGN